MPENLFAFLSFVLVTTYTPGPATISSASMGILYGYKKTFPYILGLVSGNFLVMSTIGLISGVLLRSFPILEPVLRYLGAAYILYLAFGIMRSSYTFSEKGAQPLGIAHGFMLQMLNPKLFVYAITVFSTYLASIIDKSTMVLLAALLLALNSFGSTSVWALFGTGIREHLHSKRIKTTVNATLAIFLFYAALRLVLPQ